MESKSKFLLSIFGVLIAVGAVGFWIYKDITRVEERRASDTPPVLVGDSGIKVETLPTEAPLPDAPQPDLNKPIKFGNDLGAEFERLMTDTINKNRDILRSEPRDFRAWIELAANYKIIGDFKSAEEAWYYAHLMIPDNAVVLGNLANLYAYSIQDIAKAEEYYQKALAVAGGFEYLYFQASEFYINILKDRAKAIQVVELGLQRVPNSTDLKALLDSIKSN